MPSSLLENACRTYGGVVSLVVTVGANNNGLEVLTVVTGVGGRLLIDVRAPQRALVVGNRRRVRAVGRLVVALGGVQGRVALNVDVEGTGQIG